LERLHKSDAGIFLPRYRQLLEVSGAANPSPKASFGFTEVFGLYAVSGTTFGRSADGGRTWPSAGITTPPPAVELNSIVAHPYDPFTLFIGADTGVFVSRDDGENWSPFDEKLPNAEVMQVFIERGYLYAVTHGRGLWRREIC
jgi:hypothetical protein